MGRLTDTQLRTWMRAAKPIPGKSDGGGLTFTLSSKTIASWTLRYQFAGRSRELTLGRYPEMPLAEARARALDARAKVQRGIDVASTKQTERLEQLTVATFRDLAMAWYERMIEPRVKHPRLVLGVLERHLFPVLGSTDARMIEPRHIDGVLRKIVNGGAPTVANDALRYLKGIYGFGRRRQLVPSNPASDFRLEDAGGQERSRTRALSVEEITELFRAIEKTRTLGRENAIAVKLLLLLGVRKQELMCARWSELNLEGALWTLPSERTKTGAEIKLPLPALGVRWFRELYARSSGSEFVFPARRLGRRDLGHVSPDTLNVALARIDHGLAPFTLHDLRRTLRTQLAALGIPPHIAERCLNHKPKGIEATYDRYDYLDERREVLERWAAVLVRIDLDDRSNVVGIRRTA